MRLAYLDCIGGISGNMMLGALLDAGGDHAELRRGLDALRVPGWDLRLERVAVNGISATHVEVHMDETAQPHRHLGDIVALIRQADLDHGVTRQAVAVFTRLAEAEAAVHGSTVDHVHFHEVGAVDAIVDVVGSCLLLRSLGVDEVHCSPLPSGYGVTRSMHGVIPVPPPAVTALLADVPTFGVDIPAELVTPTGAALAVTLSSSFGRLPAMRMGACGYGAGTKRFEQRPNLLRVMLGETDDAADRPAEDICVIEANIDDLLPQFYEVVMERLLRAGALDVYLTPIQMKKGRPAHKLSVIAEPDHVDALAALAFAETSTFGLRIARMRRLCVDRQWVVVETAYGRIRVKVASWHGSETHFAPEYEDVKRAAHAAGAPLKTVHLAAVSAYQAARQRVS
ncbi:MAG: nickel pincer cofactor biosynthesis protein LarC [Armatimonadetes bacterium]|nr:nickel pincer cofactor biosynthesis protein LarC [Armatimonadota bacterium]